MSEDSSASIEEPMNTTQESPGISSRKRPKNSLKKMDGNVELPLSSEDAPNSKVNIVTEIDFTKLFDPTLSF